MSRKEMMVDLKTLNTSLETMYKNINTFFLARVESYNHVNSTCSIQPLEKQKDYYGNYIDPALIIEVPVSLQKTKNFFMRVPYSKDDIILVGVAQNAFDDLIITGKPEINQLRQQGRYFDVNNSIVLEGVFTEEEEQMPDTNSEDLLILNRNNGSKIVLQKDGTVNIENGTSITIKPDGTINIVAGGSIEITSPETTIKGNVNVNGNITVTGGDVVADGISHKLHNHDTEITKGSSSGIYTSNAPK